jgi:type I restriction enzyme S subunit
MTAPKLRFKEFDEDWAASRIDEIASVTSGGTPSRSNSEYWDGNIPWVTTSLVDFNVIQTAEEFITQDGLKNSSAKLFPKNTILMAMYGQGITRGKVAILGIEATTNQACCAIKLNNSFDTHFIFQNLMNRYEEIRDLSNDGGQKNLSAGIIKEIEVVSPSKEEQTKIASFLTAVDEKISQLSQKLHLLGQYKQGMMQKLFSQQIRFKAEDGSEFGEWEYYKLGELTTLITKGTTPTSLGGKFENSGINFIKIESLSSDGKFLLDKFAYIDEVTHNKLARSQLENEDILFSIAGALGRVAIISNDYLPANTNQALAIIRLRNKNIIRYIYYFLNSDYVKKIIETESVQLAQANFSLGQLSDLDIVLPCIEEQTKIANFLSTIDQKIDVVSEQLEQAKLWKKGLLQQMFV